MDASLNCVARHRDDQATETDALRLPLLLRNAPAHLFKAWTNRLVSVERRGITPTVLCVLSRVFLRDRVLRTNPAYHA